MDAPKPSMDAPKPTIKPQNSLFKSNRVSDSSVTQHSSVLEAKVKLSTGEKSCSKLQQQESFTQKSHSESSKQSNNHSERIKSSRTRTEKYDAESNTSKLTKNTIESQAGLQSSATKVITKKIIIYIVVITTVSVAAVGLTTGLVLGLKNSNSSLTSTKILSSTSTVKITTNPANNNLSKNISSGGTLNATQSNAQAARNNLPACPFTSSSGIISINSGFTGTSLNQWAQCGGINYSGVTVCGLGLTCYEQNAYYSQCLTTGTCPSGWNCPITTTPAGTTTATVAQWAQCGGIGYTGNTQCGVGFTCYAQNDWWSACLLTGSCQSGWKCTVSSSATVTSTVSACAQCGGSGYNGSTTCDSGLKCYYVTQYGYSVCLPYCPSGLNCILPVPTCPFVTTVAFNFTQYNGPTLAQWAQCGGIGYTGLNVCPLGMTCYAQSAYYSQCLITGTCPSGWNCPTTTTATGTTTATVSQWGQCGGIGYKGNTQCGLGFTCYVQNSYWSACLQTGTCPSGWSCSTTAVVSSCQQCGGSGYTGSTTCDTDLTCYYVTEYGYSLCLPSCPPGWNCKASVPTCPYTSTVAVTSATTLFTGVTVAQWAQCGGIGYTGITACPVGMTCYEQSAYFSQCLITGTCPSGWNCPSTTTGSGIATSTVAQWGQCGGIGYTGNTLCGVGFTCYVQNEWWSQCLQTGTCPSYWTCTSISKIGSCGQCGGNGYTGTTTCDSGLSCLYVSQFGYSLCLPSCPSGWTCFASG